jgi:hypothetical protein
MGFSDEGAVLRRVCSATVLRSTAQTLTSLLTMLTDHVQSRVSVEAVIVRKVLESDSYSTRTCIDLYVEQRGRSYLWGLLSLA